MTEEHGASVIPPYVAEGYREMSEALRTWRMHNPAMHAIVIPYDGAGSVTVLNTNQDWPGNATASLLLGIAKAMIDRSLQQAKERGEIIVPQDDRS